MRDQGETRRRTARGWGQQDKNGDNGSKRVCPSVKLLRAQRAESRVKKEEDFFFPLCPLLYALNGSIIL